MLLEFSVTNFRSIKEKQTLSLLKTKKNEFTVFSKQKRLDVFNALAYLIAKRVVNNS
jgi:AAA15 family ATPase/GTPase